MKRTLCAGAIAAAAVLGTAGTAVAAAPASSQGQAAPAASWVLYESHIPGNQCVTDGQWVLAHISGVFNYWCDASDNHANDKLYALWVNQ